MMSSFFDAVLERPTPFLVCTVVWFVHGFILDIFVINVLPYLSPAASDAQRDDKFVWARGGYKNYPQVKNLGPAHRRFMAENQCYAVLRLAPIFFITNMPVLLLCAISYLIEAFTIMTEQVRYHAPPSAMLPQTLMAVFCSMLTYTVTTNADGFISNVDPQFLQVIQGICGLCWICFLVGLNASRGNSPLKKD